MYTCVCIYVHRASRVCTAVSSSAEDLSCIFVHRYIFAHRYQCVCTEGGGSEEDVVWLYIRTYIPLCTQKIGVPVLGVVLVNKTAIVVLRYIYTSLYTGHQRGCSKENSNWFTVAHQYTPTHTSLCTQGINVSVLGVTAVRKMYDCTSVHIYLFLHKASTSL